MPERMLIRAWLRQADCDLTAARVDTDGIFECHRRYWLQQACEKGIKALGALLWKSPATHDGRFRREFLHKHSPLKNLKETPEIPKPLRLLLRELETEIRSLDGSGILLRVDGTTPSTDPADVSYRYPFVDSTGTLRSPADYPDWDAYQGSIVGVTAAIAKFLKAVRHRSRIDRTMP